MGYRGQKPPEETQQKAKRLLPNLQTTFKGKEMNTTFKDIKEIKKEYHTKEKLEERAKASDATRAKLGKPLDSSTKRAIELKVKNMASDLDYIAWQLENQIELKDNPAPHYPKTEFLVNAIDTTLNMVTKLQKALKNDLRV